MNSKATRQPKNAKPAIGACVRCGKGKGIVLVCEQCLMEEAGFPLSGERDEPVSEQ